jgi:hypothetical protein
LKINKKSQAAMEFLMSYGWALLVVLLVIAALAYFGMLNPERFLPDKVNLGTGLTVTSSTLDERYLTLIVNNGMGKALYNFAINATLCGTDGVSSGSYTFAEGESKKILIPCTKQLKNSKFKSDLKVTYTTNTYGEQVSHVSSGDLKMTVNPGCKSSDILAGFSFDKDMKDCSGNGKDVTCSGNACPQLSQGKVGNAYSFDGTDDVFSVNGMSFTGSQDFTLSAYFYSTDWDIDICAPNSIFFSSVGGAWGTNMFISNDAGTFYFAVDGVTPSPPVYINPGYRPPYSSTLPLLDKWHHVAGVRQNGWIKMYIDGVEATVPVDNLNTHDGVFSNLQIGGSYCAGSGKTFKGIIDEVYIFNRALSADEVKALYLAGK